MTAEAQRYLRERQRQFPPWEGQDRVLAILGSCRPAMPAVLREMCDSTAVAAGEVGIAEPDSRCKSVATLQFSVEIYSGLMEFYLTITRVFSSGRPTDEIVQRIVAIFQNWQAGRYWDGHRYREEVLPASADQRRMAERLATCAGAFVLAHELGHVMIDTGHWPDVATATAFTQEETHADVFAVDLVLRSTDLDHARIRYAGIVLSMRVFALLGRLGFDFSQGSHPVPAARLEVLIAVARNSVASDLAAAWMKTIATALDENMEAVENVILGHGFVTEQTAERVAIRIFAMIEEGIHGRLENVVSAIAPQLQIVPERTLAEAAAKLDAWLMQPLAAGAVDPTHGLRPRMAESLRRLSRELPAPYAKYF